MSFAIGGFRDEKAFFGRLICCHRADLDDGVRQIEEERRISLWKKREEPRRM